MIIVLILVSLGFAGFGLYGIYEALASPGAIIPIVKICVYFALAFVAALAARETYLGQRPINEGDGRTAR
jgi:hypothetical protein